MELIPFLPLDIISVIFNILYEKCLVTINLTKQDLYTNRICENIEQNPDCVCFRNFSMMNTTFYKMTFTSCILKEVHILSCSIKYYKSLRGPQGPQGPQGFQGQTHSKKTCLKNKPGRSHISRKDQRQMNRRY